MNVVDKKIYQLLTNVGLAPSEAEIYIAAKGQILTSKQITDLVKFPRPTVQAGLDDLEEAGLCKATKKDQRSNYYQMLPLANLKKSIAKESRRLDDVSNQVDELDALTKSTDPITTQSTNYQEGVIELLNLALFCKSREWNIIAPYDNALRYLPADYISYFKKTRKERSIASQTLWEEQWRKKDLNLNQLLMRKPRFVPKGVAQDVPALMMSFDDNLLIISSKSSPYAEMITSKQVVETFNIIFELAWRSCKK